MCMITGLNSSVAKIPGGPFASERYPGIAGPRKENATHARRWCTIAQEASKIFSVGGYDQILFLV
jgi:hypothetical protein